MRPILSYLHLKPFREQRYLFFKLMFSYPIPLADLEAIRPNTLRSMGTALGTLFNRPLDFSSPKAAQATCNDLVTTIRWPMSPTERSAGLVELFLNSIYGNSKQNAGDFTRWMYQRYFAQGFSSDEFQRFFSIQFKGGTTKVSAKQRRVCVTIKVFDQDFIGRLAKCDAFTRDFGCFAEVDMVPALVTQIKEQFLKMLMGYIKFFMWNTTYDEVILDHLNERARAERQKFKWTVYELETAAHWFRNELRQAKDKN